MEGLAAPDAAPPGMVGQPTMAAPHCPFCLWKGPLHPSSTPSRSSCPLAPLLGWAFLHLGTLLPPHGAPLLAQPSWDGVGTTLCLP